ncbi:PBP1A family penicillin-binding protein [Oceanobacillus piezotolerans]|uniref:PBP1A family penicillin-binding protein n=1 Tax=Oceanobacillus piezotolerans TaxID=2448030 RepID=A0A498DHP8_9BACI|nr:PBP1A family penicillin-binding protein [Oceanobacillus piezotolerans]RLL45025.1 PBP1A family penicillin-binding protein [Oceanobacillus piezotolerans]
MQDNEKRYKKFRLPLPKNKKLRYTMIICVSVLFLGLIGYGGVLVGGSIVVKEEDLILNTTTTIETTDGEVIETLYHENRDYFSIEKIPQHVQDAFIAIEDRRFYDHAGIDMKSITRAVIKDIMAMSKVEGGSTITQQLAKNLFLYNDKTWSRKIKEVMAAIYLEKKLTKDEILELYLNEIYFGHGVYGVETASQFFFSKPVADLSVAEGALLAGLAKAPNGYSPINHPEKALDRRNTVLYAMDEAEKISTEARLSEQGKTLGLNVQEKEEMPWLASYVDLATKEAADKYQLSIDELRRGGYRIVVSVDLEVQQAAYEQFQNDEYFPGNTEDVEGAFVMMNQQTGEIVAALGGRDFMFGDLNRVTVTRQPGSTFKPIAVYGPAMMHEDGYTPYTIIPDQPMEEYMVSNVDDVYQDYVSIYDAIVNSKNTSAVWLLDQIGVKYAKQYLEKMGIHIEDNDLAIALGGLKYGVSPLQMMEGFRSFASGGKVMDSYSINTIYDNENNVIYQANQEETGVFDSQVAWNMTEMLTTAVEEGTAQAGDYDKALAGKTGSTQHPHVDGGVKDAWFVGYTPEYVTALWMGYDHSDMEHYLTDGSAYPTALTKAILSEVDNIHPLSEEFLKPENVESLPEPIELPEINNLHAQYEFGGLSMLRGKLVWDGSSDDRVVYRVYREQDGIDKRVAEVQGETEYVISNVLFQENSYYVVPYNPLTKLEGKRSETVKFSW